MTNRELFTALLTVVEGNAELTAEVNKRLAELDRKNAQRADKQREKHEKENAPLVNAIMEYLTEHSNGALASEIAVSCDCSTAKASALCGGLVKDEILTVAEVKVPKVGVRKKYTLAP